MKHFFVVLGWFLIIQNVGIIPEKYKTFNDCQKAGNDTIKNNEILTDKLNHFNIHFVCVPDQKSISKDL